MAIKTWTGAGANNNWNTALNWSGGTIPSTSDDIVFDGVFPVTGNKNCTFNVIITVTSINFTGYTGTFTFSGNLTVSGTMTLGTGTAYATSATVSTYTLFSTGMTLVSTGKILPVNFTTSSGTTTINGNADFQGNFAGNSLANSIKSATGVPCDLRIGGNISTNALTSNVTDHVTFKAYGTAKTFTCNGAGPNIRVTFISGSTYTSGAMGIAGTSFFTVESGGQFTGATLTSQISNSGTLTLSGFNSLNNSNFGVLSLGGSVVLVNDTVLNGLIIAAGNTVTTSTGAKLLLEGNLSGNTSNTVIDNLEFSGSTLSTVSINTSTNFQIKNIYFNKIGAGSVNFTATGFTLAIPVNTTYNWIHTAGTITGSPTSAIIISNGNTNSTLTYTESIAVSSFFTFNSLSFNQGKLQLNSRLRANTLGVSNNFQFTGIEGFTTNNFTCTLAASIITFQNINANPLAEYIVNGVLTLIGTAANRITLQSEGSATFNGTITPVGQLNYLSGTAPSVGMTVSQTTGVSPVGLIGLLPNRPVITGGTSPTFTISPSATTVIGSSFSMRAGYKAKFTLTNGTGSQNVAYVTTQDIDSNAGATITSFGSNGDDINNSTISLFRTLNWGPLIAPSGSVYYTFVN
jgi:hypothetical protein